MGHESEGCALLEDPATPSQDETLRKQSWQGMKAPIKRMASLRIPHLLLRGLIKAKPGLFTIGRLPAPAHVKAVEANMSDVNFTMLAPDRCILAKELYWGHGQRPGAADQFALDSFGALAREADLVLDIGAYTGIFSLLSARVSLKSQVHAFEIVPEVALAAIANVVANNLAERVTVHLCGVGEPSGNVTMATGAGGSALPDFYSAQMNFAGGVRIPVRGLDNLIPILDPTREARSVLIKLDTEGGEATILENASNFLTRYKPDMLCEILPGKADVATIERILRGHGYRLYRLEDAICRPLSELLPHEKYRDWLFTMLSPSELAGRGLHVAHD